MLGLEPNILSWLILTGVTVTSTVAYIPQIVLLLRTKSSDDVSVVSWIVWLIQYVAMTVYSVIFTTDIVLCIAYIIEASACAWVLMLVVHYRRKQRRN